jgi:hypothetical protein
MNRTRALALFVGALMLAALWSAQSGATAQENPALASLEIDVWPEFDRPAALVIYRAELAADVALPAAVSLRIPTSAGGPAAVASAPSVDATLITIPWERSDVQVDFTTLTFEAPNRFFHVEFYDPLKTDGSSHSYKYTWTGDFAVGELRAQVQKPATATELTVQPELGADITGPNGFVYREANLGAFEAGKSLTVDVSYRKSDPRTSAEILGLATPTVDSPGSADSDGGIPRWLIGAALLGAAAVVAAGFVIWRRRQTVSSHRR